MSDVTAVKEALDLLSTEDGLLNRISRHDAVEFVEAVAVVSATARRWVALTETGPDATVHLCQAIHEDEYGFLYAVCSCGEYRTAPVLDIDMLVDELMAHAVRAALADYLTEEE